MIEKLVSCITCNCISSENGGGGGKRGKIQGRVVLMKKNVLDFNDFVASAADRLGEVFSQRVSLQLVSKVNVADDANALTVRMTKGGSNNNGQQAGGCKGGCASGGQKGGGSSFSAGANSDTMKAPGQDGYISRSGFEANPSGYFSDLHKK